MVLLVIILVIGIICIGINLIDFERISIVRVIFVLIVMVINDEIKVLVIYLLCFCVFYVVLKQINNIINNVRLVLFMLKIYFSI